MIAVDNPPPMHKDRHMASRPPSAFRPALTDARLRIVSEALLDVLYDTELELDGPLDDGYTRGTTTFGRQRNAIISLAQGGKHPWMKLTHAGMDVTFEIEGVPCRFFADDPANPKKPGFFRRNDSDQLFERKAGDPVLFRFVVAKPQSAEEDADVVFVGYDANGVEAFSWHHSRSTPVIASVDTYAPDEVALPPAKAKVREAQHSQDKAVGDSSDADSQG